MSAAFLLYPRNPELISLFCAVTSSSLPTKSSWHFSAPCNVAAAQKINTRARAFNGRDSAAQAAKALMTIISVIVTALGQQGQQLILLQSERGYFHSSNWPQPAAGIDVLPLLSVCCLPCSDAAAVPHEHKLPAAVNESDCFAPIIDQTKPQPLSHPQLIGDECSVGTTASREPGNS